MTTKRYHPPRTPPKARVIVTAPAKFFGRWRFTLKWPGERDLKNTAQVTDERLKFRWAKNQGAGVMSALTWSANKAVRDIAGRGRICG